ncbi:MAG: phospholipid carrier-dependent glycosyltransferase [Chitinivibrionales bacterium]|nr:phospholipid carrier-dependent glycosyltransferase [Chitinivibrionales bacterium]
MISLGSIYLCYLIGRKLVNKQTGLVAALIMALLPLHLTNSVRIVPNMLLLLLTACTIYCSLLYLHSDRRSGRWLILSSVFAGLSLGTKYLFIAPLAPILSKWLRDLDNGREFFDKRLLIIIAVAAAAFFISTPFSIISFDEFIRDINFERMHYKEGHPGAETSFAIFRFLKYLLFHGATPLLFAVCLAGIAWSTKDKSRESLVIYSIPVLWFFYAGTYKVTFAHNILTFSIALSIGGAYVLSKINNRKLQILLIAAIAAYPAIIDFGHIKQRIKPDIRHAAEKWVNSNLLAGSKIGQEVYTCFPDSKKVDVVFSGICGTSYMTSDSIRALGYDHLIMASHSRFSSDLDKYADKIANNESHLKEFEEVKVFNPGKEYQGDVFRILKFHYRYNLLFPTISPISLYILRFHPFNIG